MKTTMLVGFQDTLSRPRHIRRSEAREITHMLEKQFPGVGFDIRLGASTYIAHSGIPKNMLQPILSVLSRLEAKINVDSQVPITSLGPVGNTGPVPDDNTPGYSVVPEKPTA